MSEAKFTKLKWGIEKDKFDDSGEWFEIHASSESYYISKHIADVYSGEGDANLIAAAPEMYRKLEHVAEFFDSLCEDDAANEIKALLAKARGEL